MLLTAIVRQNFEKSGTVCQFPQPHKRQVIKILRVMKLTLLLLIGFCLGAYAKGFSQKITLSENNVSLQVAFKKIERQSGYSFIYRDELITNSKKVSIKVVDASLEEVLGICFQKKANIPFHPTQLRPADRAISKKFSEFFLTKALPFPFGLVDCFVTQREQRFGMCF